MTSHLCEGGCYDLRERGPSVLRFGPLRVLSGVLGPSIVKGLSENRSPKVDLYTLVSSPGTTLLVIPRSHRTSTSGSLSVLEQFKSMTLVITKGRGRVKSSIVVSFRSYCSTPDLWKVGCTSSWHKMSSKVHSREGGEVSE